MSEPESLSTQEPLADHLRRHAYDRLLMLSDGIFAIATTLAALEIHLPERMPSLEELTFDLARPLVAYLLSFVVTAIFWISHRNLFARLRKVDAVLTGLTLAMLCMIALVPVALHGMTVQGGAGVAIRFYAVIMLACGLANSAMWIYGSFRPGLMLDAVPTAERRVRAALTLAIPLLFGVILVTPTDTLPVVFLPVAVVVILLRRFVLPRYLGRRAATT